MEKKMKYAIDKILNNIVTIENLDTKEIKNISIKKFPNNIKEGNIVVKNNNKYVIDKELENTRRKLIKDKVNRLKAL